MAKSSEQKAAVWPKVVLLGVLGGPVLAGLAGTLLPAFGYLPALGATEFTVKPFQDVLNTSGLETSLFLSLGTGLGSTALSLLVMLIFAASWYGTRSFAIASKLLSPLLAVPHAAAAFGLAFLVAPSGFLVRVLSPWATGFDRPPDVLILNDPYGLSMTFALVLKEVPFLFLMMLAALPQTRSLDHTKAARNLGYGRVHAFFSVAVPQLYPQIRLPVFAVLAYATSVVDVAIILGPTTPAPLAPRILVWLFDTDPAIRLQASAAAVLQVLVTATAMFIWIIGEVLIAKLYKALLFGGTRMRRDALLRYIAKTSMWAVLAIMFSGFFVLGVWSFSGSWWFPSAFPVSWTSSYWSHAVLGDGTNITTTILIALGATLPCLFLVLWLLESSSRSNLAPGSKLKAILFIPLLVPQICFLFGLFVLFVTLGLEGSLLAVVLSHFVFVLPYVFLSLADPWRHLDPKYIQIAASLGASKWRIFWRIRLPILLQPLLIAIAVGFAVSVGQYLPTALVGAGRITTVTTESIALASGSNRQLLSVYAILQLLLPSLVFALAIAVPSFVFRNRSALAPKFRS